MQEQIFSKNLIIGVGGAGTNFVDTAKTQNYANTALFSIESEEELLNCEHYFLQSKKIFIVGGFRSPNKGSAFDMVELILNKIQQPKEQIYFMAILPFRFEGVKGMDLTLSRIKILQDLGYKVLTFNNQDLISETNENKKTLVDKFKEMDLEICKKISELL